MRAPRDVHCRTAEFGSPGPEVTVIRIYADFNHHDEQGRVLLDTVGSLADITKHEAALAEGMVVLQRVRDRGNPAARSRVAR